MKKKKHNSVVNLLIAASVLFLAGSSGGVAWGQIWNDTGGPYGASKAICEGSYTIQSWDWSQNADNKFGPGETGVIIPLAGPDNSTNSGTHIASSSNINVTRTPFNPDGNSGIITVGGTQNRVQNVHSHSDRKELVYQESEL